MKKILISILLSFSFLHISAERIPNDLTSSINDEITKRVKIVEDEIKKNSSYITDDQLVEYQNDLAVYSAAIQDAIYASPEEISQSLLSITPWNNKILQNKEKTHILVVSWMSKWAYENFYKQYNKDSKEKYSIKNLSPKQSGPKFEYLSWVTIPYETKTFILDFMKNKQKNISLQKRLTQRLGLPPEVPSHEAEKVFVELWVQPEDLIRPCINNNLLGTSCSADLYPAKLSTPFDDMFKIAGTTDKAYITWYKEQREKTYSSDFMPWTRLGYTFDWGTNFQRKSLEKSPEKGSTEFIIRPGAKVFIEGATPTEEYYKNRESSI